MREPEGELDLEDYFDLFRRRWRWVVGTLILVAGLVTLFTLTREERFESRAEVQFLTEDNKSTFNVLYDELFRRAVAELQFVGSDTYDARVDELAGFDVEVTGQPIFVDSGEKIDSVGLLRLVVQDSTPDRAARGAEAAASAYLELRVANMTQSIGRRLDDRTDQRNELRDERTTLNTEISDAFAAAEAATDPISRSQLVAAAELLRTEYNPSIQSLTSRIGALNEEIAYIDAVLDTLAQPESTARLRASANRPLNPISPNVPRNVMISIVVGLVLGIILAVVRDLLDTRARDGADLARLVDIPVMATIGEIRSQRGAPGRVRRYRDLSAEESSGYQVLLNSLWLTNVDDPLQSIVFTSDRPEVGKTQTVVNLAQAEAARGTRVLVIDTDFVNPSVATRLDLGAGELGLADLLEGRAAIEQVVMPTEVPNLHIIDAQGSSTGGELLRSDRLGGVLTDLYSRYDLILIDSPPTLSTSDSRLVASQADAVVVVYDPALSRREELQRTIDLLRSARANLIGLVANRSRSSHLVYLSARDR